MKWFKLAHPFAGSHVVLVVHGRIATQSPSDVSFEHLSLCLVTVIGDPWITHRERYEARGYTVTELKDPDTETVKA